MMNDSTFYIYKITNLINGKIYIGQTDNPSRRWREHIYVTNAGKEKAKNKFLVINAAMTKYGISNFNMEIIEETKSQIQIDYLEKYWIAQLKDSGYQLYNADSGGKVLRGKEHHMYGKHHTPETKKLIGIKSKGRECFWKGKKLSTNVKAKISVARIKNKIAAGENNPSAKLTAIQIEEIKILLDKITHATIAKKYNVGTKIISNIKTGIFDINKSEKLTPIQFEEIKTGTYWK